MNLQQRAVMQQALDALVKPTSSAKTAEVTKALRAELVKPIKPALTCADPVTDGEVDMALNTCDTTYDWVSASEMRRVLEGFAAGRAAVVVPEGWQLVPVEPTGMMKDAGCGSLPLGTGPWNAGDCYRSMLRYAPKPPALPIVIEPAVVEPSGNQFISPFKFEREEISDSTTKGKTHE